MGGGGQAGKKKLAPRGGAGAGRGQRNTYRLGTARPWGHGQKGNMLITLGSVEGVGWFFAVQLTNIWRKGKPLRLCKRAQKERSTIHVRYRGLGGKEMRKGGRKLLHSKKGREVKNEQLDKARGGGVDETGEGRSRKKEH